MNSATVQRVRSIELVAPGCDRAATEDACPHVPMAPTSVVYEFVSVAVPDDAIDLRLSDHIVRMVQDTVLQQLLLWSGVGLALIALLTGFTGWWLVGRALAPVAAMTDTARRIASLLLLARSDLGLDEDETEESDLRDAAHQAVGKLLPQAEEKKVSLELAADGPMPVIGDPVLLRHLMTNLVDNAVRYNTVWACPSSHRSAQAHAARVTARPRQGGGLTVSVTFTGT